MSTAEELVVALRSEGANEVASDMEQVEDQVESAGDATEATGAEIEGVTQKLSGAMAAVLAGVSIAVGGLLSQVPILGGTVEALGGIVTGLAFKLDETLRPALTDTNDDLRDTESAVFESEGFFEGLMIAVDGVGQALQNTSTQSLQKEIKELTGITIPENWLDLGWDLITMDGQNALNNLKETITNFGPDVATLIEGWFPNWAQNVREGWANTKDAFGDIGEFGSTIVEGFISGLQKLPQRIVNVMTNALNRMIDTVNKAIDSLPDRVTSRLGIEKFDNFEAPDIGGENGSTDSFAGGGRGPRFDSSSNNGTYLDGRRVDEQTGRFGRDTTARRGI